MSETRPAWLDRVVRTVRDDPPHYFSQFPPPAEPERRSAVLILFGPSPAGGEEVVLTERPWSMRSHAGQVAFPGGGVDPSDVSLAAAALREGHEEVGLRPESVDVVTELPGLYMTPSRNAVSPVLAWWRDPHELYPASPMEVERVERVRVADLVDPEHRFTVVHPRGYRGPAFQAGGLYVWGFTAQLLSTVLDLADLAEPWDEQDERELPARMSRTAWRR